MAQAQQAALALAGKDFKVTIPRPIYDQVMHWVWKAGRNEISGFGTVIYDEKEKEFTVKNAILLDQENQAAHTEIDGTALAKAMYELREGPGEIRWWWHSHVQMGVFWSSTDMDTIRELGSRGWILATVFNQKEERRSAFLTTAESPLTKKHEIFVDDIPTTAVSFYETPVFDAWNASFDEKVKEKKWVAPSVGAGNRSGSNAHHGTGSLIADAMYERKAIDEFTWFSSPMFAKDGRFVWRAGGTNEAGHWEAGGWEVIPSLKEREATVRASKINEIKAHLRRGGGLFADEDDMMGMDCYGHMI